MKVLNSMNTLEIRSATPEDWSALARGNVLLAEETEGKQLCEETVGRGVRAVLADVNKGRYFVACSDGRIVGQVMHTWEWSDWRDGTIWWLQSVYVESDYRKRGVFRALYEHLHSLAEADENVVGLRLYVEHQNRRAQDTYQKLGMQTPGYTVMESMFD